LCNGENEHGGERRAAAQSDQKDQTLIIKAGPR
jgi:hypothetical protein